MSDDKLLGARNPCLVHDQQPEDGDGDLRCASASTSVRVRDDHHDYVSLEDVGPGLPPNFSLAGVVS